MAMGSLPTVIGSRKPLEASMNRSRFGLVMVALVFAACEGDTRAPQSRALIDYGGWHAFARAAV